MRGVFDNFGPKTFLQLLLCSYFTQNINILFVDLHTNTWPLYRVCVCVCMCECVCVRECMCECVCVCGVYMCECV